MGINVIYEKGTNKIIAIEENGEYVLPKNLDIQHYENGVEPILLEIDRVLYLEQNVIMLDPKSLA